jgi:acyl-coenzyme A thioesterase PaaI-like protein
LSIRHHELCFGCGRQNLFGLQLELEQLDGGGVGGRFFVKQDHQGPPGVAHGGIVATALDEAMALAIHAEGVLALTNRLEFHLERPAAVGDFVELSARIERREGRRVHVAAEAHDARGERIARGRGTFVEAAAPD